MYTQKGINNDFTKPPKLHKFIRLNNSVEAQVENKRNECYTYPNSTVIIHEASEKEKPCKPIIE